MAQTAAPIAVLETIFTVPMAVHIVGLVMLSSALTAYRIVNSAVPWSELTAAHAEAMATLRFAINGRTADQS